MKTIQCQICKEDWAHSIENENGDVDWSAITNFVCLTNISFIKSGPCGADYVRKSALICHLCFEDKIKPYLESLGVEFNEATSNISC